MGQPGGTVQLSDQIEWPDEEDIEIHEGHAAGMVVTVRFTPDETREILTRQTNANKSVVEYVHDAALGR